VRGAEAKRVQLVGDPVGVGGGELELQAKRPAIRLGPPALPERQDAVGRQRDAVVGPRALYGAPRQPPLDRERVLRQADDWPCLKQGHRR